MRGDFGDVLEVLPVHAAPSDAFIVLGELDVAIAGLYLAAEEAVLIEAGAGLDLLGLNLLVAYSDLHEGFAGE